MYWIRLLLLLVVFCGCSGLIVDWLVVYLWLGWWVWYLWLCWRLCVRCFIFWWWLVLGSLWWLCLCCWWLWWGSIGLVVVIDSWIFCVCWCVNVCLVIVLYLLSFCNGVELLGFVGLFVCGLGIICLGSISVFWFGIKCKMGRVGEYCFWLLECCYLLIVMDFLWYLESVVCRILSCCLWVCVV